MGSGFADSAAVAGTPSGTAAGEPTTDAAEPTAAPTAGADPGEEDTAAEPSPSGAAGPTRSAGGTGTSGSVSGTFDGTAAQTRFGPVQVRIIVSSGKITDVQALQVPNGNHHDAAINGHALPILREETLAAQSADIDTVSGATITSDGYRESLQAAIDAAHL
jgi:uncharacterized protein with FMN-binding domain